jgi:hypothetical protein
MKSSQSKSTGSKGQKENCCSKCGWFSRGHIWPQGRHCNMADSPVRPVQSRTPLQPDFDSLSVGEDGNDSAIRELASQIGRLTMNMEHMQKDLHSLKENVPAMASTSMNATGTSTISSVKHKDEEPSPKASDTYECLASGAKVSSKVIKLAINGEFVNLAEFCPILEPSNITEALLTDGELTFKQKRDKNIDSFLIWSLVWRAYEELLVDHDHTLYNQLVAYRIWIQTCAARYWWNSVYSYDVRNRSKKSMTKSFNFNLIDHYIYVSCMDAATTRTNVKQCARCKSIWHGTKDCPFQTADPAEVCTYITVVCILFDTKA